MGWGGGVASRGRLLGTVGGVTVTAETAAAAAAAVGEAVGVFRDATDLGEELLL